MLERGALRHAVHRGSCAYVPGSSYPRLSAHAKACALRRLRRNVRARKRSAQAKACVLRRVKGRVRQRPLPTEHDELIADPAVGEAVLQCASAKKMPVASVDLPGERRVRPKN